MELSPLDRRDILSSDFIYLRFHGMGRVLYGYKLPVATIEDVLAGKIWATQDETRRLSKRQKDLADILHLIEVKSSLKALIPDAIKENLLL